MKPLADVEQGDLVNPIDWGGSGPEVGRVLAVLPVPGRAWPDVVVIEERTGGEVKTWRRWRFVKDAPKHDERE
jgi:hypothetical protein